MPMNPILRRDIDGIERNEGEQYMSPRMSHLSPVQLGIVLRQITKELQETFNVYGLDWTEENVQAAMIGLIWQAKATLTMFQHGSPTMPENDHPLGHALHPQITAFHVLNYALSDFTDDERST